MNHLDLLLPQPVPEQDTWTWATVTQASPLRVRLDGDTAALSIEPESLVTGLVAGQRVWVQLTGRRVVVHAPSGGVVTTTTPQKDVAPVGTVVMSIDTAAPNADYLICNGGTFSSTTYPTLAAIVGSRFGPSSGTTYYLPDLRTRFPIGAGTLDAGAVGATGGSASITSSNLPAHTHAIDHDHAAFTTGVDGAHDHRARKGTGSGTNFAQYAPGNAFDVATDQIIVKGEGAHSHSIDVPPYSGSSGSTGSGSAYYPPYMTLNFIVKAR